MATNIDLITWDEPSKAYKALNDITTGNWNFNLRQAYVLERKTDGGFVIKDGNQNVVGMGTLGGSLIGMVIGVLGGPLGVLLGWAGGALFGSLVDMDKAVDSTSILAAMSKSIPPGGTALVMEVDEPTTEALDAFAAQSGGTVLRRSAEEVRVEVAAAADAVEAASKEANRVLREQRHAETKEKLESAWDDLKAKFKNAFS